MLKDYVIWWTYSLFRDRSFAAGDSKLWNRLLFHLKNVVLTLISLNACLRHFSSFVGNAEHCEKLLNDVTVCKVKVSK